MHTVAKALNIIPSEELDYDMIQKGGTGGEGGTGAMEGHTKRLHHDAGQDLDTRA